MAAWPSAAKSSSPAEVPPAATAATAATSLCPPPSVTTPSSTSASIPSGSPSAAATASAPTCPDPPANPLTLNVPVGTLLYDDETGELIHDFTQAGDTIAIARGGRGGRGNQHFATSTHQAPREHELGRSGEERRYRLELRLLADAGLVGYPNVVKSTLISRHSAARPKIADYAFTTLDPNLGVVQVGEFPHTESFTVADLPGLIEGAHLGHGLGIQFLRHIERTSVIVHLVDVSDSPTPSEHNDRTDPVEDFKLITAELKSFDPALAAKPTILVAAKADVANPAKLKKLAAFAKRRKLPFYPISAVTGEGIEPLKYAIAELVAIHRPIATEPTPEPAAKPKPAYPHPLPAPAAAPDNIRSR